jgi:hypothetical protein
MAAANADATAAKHGQIWPKTSLTFSSHPRRAQLGADVCIEKAVKNCMETARRVLCFQEARGVP